MGFLKATRDVAFTGLVVVGTVKLAIVSAPLLAGGAVAKGVWHLGHRFVGNNARRTLHNYNRLPDDKKTTALVNQVAKTAFLQADIGLAHGVADHIIPPGSH